MVKFKCKVCGEDIDNDVSGYITDKKNKYYHAGEVEYYEEYDYVEQKNKLKPKQKSKVCYNKDDDV